MNSQDIYNAVTDIRDGQIEEAATPPKKKKIFIKFAAAAAVFALCVAVGTAVAPLLKNAKIPDGGGAATLHPKDGENAVTEEQKIPDGEENSFEMSKSLKKHAIAYAEYPETTKYRERMSSEELTKYYDESRERSLLARDYAPTAEGFVKTSVPAVLSGADGKNAVYSPLNLYIALSVLAEISDGPSREQILGLLECKDISEARKRASALWKGNYADDGTVLSLLANSIWLDDGVKYNSETAKRLAEDYYASAFSGEMGSAEYDGLLQEWINENTGGLLKEAAGGQKFSPDAVLGIVSTIYYGADWTEKFVGETTPGVFHSPNGDKTADFMHDDLDYCYFGDKFTAVSKGLTNSGGMDFILPDEGVEIDELLSDSNFADFITDARSAGAPKPIVVHMSVPKFDVASDAELSETLKTLGVTDIFDPTKADFSPILSKSDGAFISRVDHAARVEIDEDGVKAAAFTSVMLCGAAMPPEEEMDFTLDRPFIFVIRGSGGSVLFVGVVNEVGD